MPHSRENQPEPEKPDHKSTIPGGPSNENLKHKRPHTPPPPENENPKNRKYFIGGWPDLSKKPEELSSDK